MQRQSTGARQQKVGAKEAIHKAMLDEKRATDERETSKKRSLDEDAEELLAEKKGNLKKAKLRDEFRTRSSVHSAILSRREITKAKALHEDESKKAREVEAAAELAKKTEAAAKEASIAAAKKAEFLAQQERQAAAELEAHQKKMGTFGRAVQPAIVYTYEDGENVIGKDDPKLTGNKGSFVCSRGAVLWERVYPEQVDDDDEAGTSHWKERGPDRRLSSVVEDTRATPPAELTSSKKEKNHVAPDKKIPTSAPSWKDTVRKFTQLAGRRIRVLGNGFCWQYAVLAAAGVMESPERPTTRDYFISNVLTEEMQKRLRGGSYRSWLDSGSEYAQRVLSLTAPATANSSGVYCGDVCHRILASIMQNDILIISPGAINPNRTDVTTTEVTCSFSPFACTPSRIIIYPISASFYNNVADVN